MSEVKSTLDPANNNNEVLAESTLFSLSEEEKYNYMKNVVYENVTHSSTGKLIINTNYARKTAELLGGNYDSLSKTEKHIFKSYITSELIYPPYNDFKRYIGR